MSRDFQFTSQELKAKLSLEVSLIRLKFRHLEVFPDVRYYYHKFTVIAREKTAFTKAANFESHNKGLAFHELCLL